MGYNSTRSDREVLEDLVAADLAYTKAKKDVALVVTQKRSIDLLRASEKRNTTLFLANEYLIETQK